MHMCMCRDRQVSAHVFFSCLKARRQNCIFKLPNWSWFPSDNAKGRRATAAAGSAATVGAAVAAGAVAGLPDRTSTPREQRL